MSDGMTNPLRKSWDQPFGLPCFGEISVAHFQPAFDAALDAHNTEVAAIADNGDPPTFANTVVALECSGAELERIAHVFFTLAAAHTSPELQAVQRTMAPRLAAHFDAITSNTQLFARIESVVADAKADPNALSAEDQRLLERVHRNFIRAGAALTGPDKTRHSDIKRRLAELSTAFSQNVLADENDWVLELSAPDDLAGLPDDLVDAAAAAARERGSNASHVITLARSLVEPFLTYSARADLREQAFNGWAARGANGNANDNRAIVAEVLALRAERARLLGFQTFADYKLEHTMAETPARARGLLDAVWKPARESALRDAVALEEAAKSDGINGPLRAADWRYYAETVRRKAFNIDEAEIKPYLSLDQVIAAAFDVAHRLFGLSFTPVDGLDLYHDDLRAWDVSDQDGQHVGLFIGDYFARSSKRSGAWMNTLRDQSRVDGIVRPIVLNTCNFAKAADGAPTLLSLDDARTLFHEFGHALHGLLSDVTYASMSGTSVSTDFVELPSQLYEHWLLTDDVLDRFARHYRTGDPMPPELRARLRKAQNFNQGFKTVEYLASALVDLELHARAAKDTDDPMALQTAILTDIGMPDAIVMRHAIPHFLHLFAGDGYAAGYYSYMWSEVLDADAFRAFEETGNVFDPDTARRLKDLIYAAGAMRKEDEAYIAFRGRMPTVDGLLAKRGFAEAVAT
ncbi:MAG: M3 family metallopeptidase [Pseudomonadota bacterium]